MNLNLTPEQISDISEALASGARRLTDIDNYKHYTEDELAALHDKAQRWTQLSEVFRLCSTL